MPYYVTTDNTRNGGKGIGPFGFYQQALDCLMLLLERNDINEVLIVDDEGAPAEPAVPQRGENGTIYNEFVLVPDNDSAPTDIVEN